MVFGPTLLDVAHKLQVGVGLLSLMFLVRAVGTVLGTVGSGVLMDHFQWMSYTLLCLILIGGMASKSTCSYTRSTFSSMNKLLLLLNIVVSHFICYACTCTYMRILLFNLHYNFHFCSHCNCPSLSAYCHAGSSHVLKWYSIWSTG